MRAYNCLRRSGLITIGQVLEKSEEELLALRNFGRKSYDELRDKLDEMNILSREGDEEEHFDAPPLSDDETPVIPRRQPEAELEPEAEPAIEPEIEAPSIEPAPVGRRKSKAAKEKAPAEPEGESDEEIEDWKRKLLQLTGEGEEAEG
jgi:DNA-directed RNA polymerase subunit alpha